MMTILLTSSSNQSNRVDYTGLIICGHKLQWGQDVPGHFYFSDCVIDGVKVSPDVVDVASILLSICCVYIYVRLVMSSYLLFCCIYFDAWCITSRPKREETLEVYTE